MDPLFLVQSVPGPYVSSLPPNSVLDRWRGISKIDFELSLLLLCVYFVSPLPYRVCECVCALPLRKFMADHFVLPPLPSLLAFEAVESKSVVVLC